MSAPHFIQRVRARVIAKLAPRPISEAERAWTAWEMNRYAMMYALRVVSGCPRAMLAPRDYERKMQFLDDLRVTTTVADRTLCFILAQHLSTKAANVKAIRDVFRAYIARMGAPAFSDREWAEWCGHHIFELDTSALIFGDDEVARATQIAAYEKFAHETYDKIIRELDRV